jgi:hypothetical protein
MFCSFDIINRPQTREDLGTSLLGEVLSVGNSNPRIYATAYRAQRAIGVRFSSTTTVRTMSLVSNRLGPGPRASLPALTALQVESRARTDAARDQPSL